MPRTTYTLRIERPEEIEPSVLAEIEDGAEEQDTTLPAKIERWLGGIVDDAEGSISAELPEGWYAAIDAESA